MSRTAPGLNVPCPRCGAGQNAPCVRPAGHVAALVHRDRDRAASDAGAVTVCPAADRQMEMP